MKRKEKVKEIAKTILTILCLYVLLVLYLLFCDFRFQRLNEESYTQAGHNKALKIEIGK